MSRVIFNHKNGTFFDYDSDKFITISGAENFDKLDEEARHKIIEELDSMGYEYAPGDFNMLYGEPDFETAYPKADEEKPIASVIFNDDKSVTVISDEETFILCEDGKRIDLSIDDNIIEDELYDISPIKTIWYNVKNGTEDTIKFNMQTFLITAVYDYFTFPKETYSDMTNDVLKLNREVITNHKLDEKIIKILQRYPEEYDRAVKRFFEVWETDAKIKRYASKEQVIELLN